MNKVREQLKSMAAALASLSSQVDKLAQHVEKMAAPKSANAKAAAQKAPATAVVKKKSAPKAAAAKKKTAPKPKAAPAKVATAAKPASVLDSVMEFVGKSRNGITIAQLKEKTGLQSRQVSNALYKLTKRGAVTAKSRGIYIKKK